MVGAVRWTVCPGAMSPVLKALFRAVKVWSTLSSFVTVILAPTATVKSSGWKAKFLMMMWIDDTGAEEVLEAADELAGSDELVAEEEWGVLGVLEEQAARASAPADTKTTRPKGRRRQSCRRLVIDRRAR